MCYKQEKMEKPWGLCIMCVTSREKNEEIMEFVYYVCNKQGRKWRNFGIYVLYVSQVGKKKWRNPGIYVLRVSQ